MLLPLGVQAPLQAAYSLTFLQPTMEWLHTIPKALQLISTRSSYGHLQVIFENLRPPVSIILSLLKRLRSVRDDFNCIIAAGGLDGFVSALVPFQSRLIVGGSFTAAYGSSGSVLKCGGIAQWNPATLQWGPVGISGTGLAPGSVVLAFAAPTATRLIVGGRFAYAGEKLANNIAIFEGSLSESGKGSISDWQPMGSGVGGGYVATIAVSGASKNLVYVGGTFLSVFGSNSKIPRKFRCQYVDCLELGTDPSQIYHDGKMMRLLRSLVSLS